MYNYSRRDIYSSRRSRRRKPAYALYGIIIGLLVVLIGVLCAFLFLGDSKELPSDISTDIFSAYLQAGQTADAVHYWDTALEAHTSNGATEAINLSLGNELARFVSECFLYVQNDNFNQAVFDAKYLNLPMFGARVTGYFSDGVDALLNAYVARGISYDRLVTSFGRLQAITSIEGAINNASITAETYYNSRTAYQSAVALALDGDYLGALAQLDKINSIDTETYAAAQARRTEYMTGIYDTTMAEATSYAQKYNFSKAVSLLVELQKYFPDDTDLSSLINTYQKNLNQTLVTYTGQVNHFFTHCLVAFPELGFKEGAAGTYDVDCITPYEFKKVIQSLYDNGYILIDINMLYEEVETNGNRTTVKKASLKLPQGKKPIVLSIDDVVYDSRKMGQGMVDKLIVDEQGKIASYTRMADGREIISYDNEIFPILDAFIEEHPDFSFNGARGTLALTGFEGILGYRTQAGSPNRESEIAECKKVIAALKENGWNFGSHSYGHRRMSTCNPNTFIAEVAQWEEEVVPLVGESAIYFYPYGDWIFASAGSSPTGYADCGAMHQALFDAGFRIFNSVGNKQNYFVVMSDKQGLFMDRRSIDGYTLRNCGEYYKSFFNCAEVYDHAARSVPYPEA